jgi:hypothetical protein
MGGGLSLRNKAPGTIAGDWSLLGQTAKQEA